MQYAVRSTQYAVRSMQYAVQIILVKRLQYAPIIKSLSTFLTFSVVQTKHFKLKASKQAAIIGL